MAERNKVWIATSKDLIKSVKTRLEQLQQFDRGSKILRIDKCLVDSFAPLILDEQPLTAFDALVPTKTAISLSVVNPVAICAKLRETFQLTEYEGSNFAMFISTTSCAEEPASSTANNPVQRAVQIWLRTVPDIPQAVAEELLSAETWSYQVYTPLLLLGLSTFTSNSWRKLENRLTPASNSAHLYQLMCSETKCTHLAINAPILLHATTASASPGQLNVLRSPSGLTPLHGNFGNATDEASQSGFEDAFWVHVLQNGIHQTFAPLHTMFSRGNIKEKARILQMARAEESPFTAVDLYAGIGYFAFSYAKGGADIVLAWEINSWSVEGFQRGSERNGWAVTKCRESTSVVDLRSPVSPQQHHAHQTRLAIFEESNEFAAIRVERLRNTIPPVKHVNCGYLPSSQDSWDTAVQCLDPLRGGCIHAHENVATASIEERKLEIEECFRGHAARQFPGCGARVHCERVEQVKSYAPGVIHCVFDIQVSLRP